MEGESRIDEALNLLNTAAKEKKNEISKLITERYSDLRDTIVSQSKTMINDHPMLVVGSIAAAGLGLGYLIGRKQRT
ncbi:MAG: hypothetical protein ACM3OC_06790 [Deltaproteobacteria bacterium]